MIITGENSSSESSYRALDNDNIIANTVKAQQTENHYNSEWKHIILYMLQDYSRNSTIFYIIIVKKFVFQ